MVCFGGRDIFSFSSFLPQLCVLGRELQREFMLATRWKTKIGIRSRKAGEYFFWRFCFVGYFRFVGNSGAYDLLQWINVFSQFSTCCNRCLFCFCWVKEVLGSLSRSSVSLFFSSFLAGFFACRGFVGCFTEYTILEESSCCLLERRRGKGEGLLLG